MSYFNGLQADRIAARLKALSNPSRLRIFVKLTQSCAPAARCSADAEGMRHCVGELGRDLGVAPSTVSHHIKELRQAGLIRVERHGQNVHCWIDADAVRSLADFFEGASAACSSPDRTAAQ